MKKISIKILDDCVLNYLPDFRYVTSGSAGLDLPACIKTKKIIRPGETYLVNTGIAIYIEDKSVAGIILPRSGLGHKHGIVLGNSVGLIDSDYQGEILVSLWNRGCKDFFLVPGKRVAQLLFFPIFQVKFFIVKSFSLFSDRGVKGFGHSM